MIKDIEVWRAFEDALLRSEPVDYAMNLRIAEAALDEARLLGVFPPKDPLEGLDVKIRLAKVLNGVR